MAKWEVEITTSYSTIDECHVEVEADTEEEAKELALKEVAEGNVCWKDKGQEQIDEPYVSDAYAVEE